MSKAQQVDTLENALVLIKPRLADVLPSHIKPEYVVRSVMLATAKTPKLRQCQPISVLQAVMTAAQLGLDCSGAGGEAYLVPYKDNCQLIIGYQGLVDLARRSGLVRSIEATLVYADERERFHYQRGTDPRIDHIPMLAAEDDAREVIAAYAVAFLTGGGFTFEVMDIRQLARIRDGALTKAGDRSTPWKTDLEEMYRKCPTRRLAKYLPKSAEFRAASILAAANEGGGGVDYSHLGEYGTAASRLAQIVKPESLNAAPQGIDIPDNVREGIEAHEKAKQGEVTSAEIPFD